MPRCASAALKPYIKQGMKFFAARVNLLWFLALGGLVTQRVARWDVSVTFLLSWATLLALRIIVFGYAWNPGAAMWLQEIANGATLLFAFFLISDPMTTPQQRGARLAYAVAVACGAWLDCGLVRLQLGGACHQLAVPSSAVQLGGAAGCAGAKQADTCVIAVIAAVFHCHASPRSMPGPFDSIVSRG
ncbi:MAG TPA: RnfABCDGE type electron transport complex subunit D [Steroidobacteraceae bacterium]